VVFLANLEAQKTSCYPQKQLAGGHVTRSP
jgi:hypothetical protein